MTKGKRKITDVNEVLDRPWCYYCEKDFDDLKILTLHQKARHFKCERCGRRLNTAGGLSVHMNQVHKEQLTEIEHALEHRVSPSIEIFGMEGIPDDIVQDYRRRVLSEFYRIEAEHRSKTGNPPPGTAPQVSKKPKIESKEELRARLAEHKAKKQAEKNGSESDTGTPVLAHASHEYFGPTPPPGLPVSPYSAGPSPPSAYAAPFTAPPPQIFNPQLFPSQPYNPQPYSPQGPPAHVQMPAGFNGGLLHQHKMSTGPPRQNSLPSAPVPGLPQRPSFNSPAMSKEDMAKLHTGVHGPLPGNVPAHLPYVGNLSLNGTGQTNSADHEPSPQQTRQEIGDSIDDLIASVTEGTKVKEEFTMLAPHPPAAIAPPAQATQEHVSTPPAADTEKEKKPKKPVKMFYSPADPTVSPDETIAGHNRYIFNRQALDAREKPSILDEADIGAVTGTVDGA